MSEDEKPKRLRRTTSVIEGIPVESSWATVETPVDEKPKKLRRSTSIIDAVPLPVEESPRKKLTTLDVLPNILAASFGAQVTIIEFTIPQVVALSQTTAQKLPQATFFPHRAKMFAQMIGPQTALTVLQFGLVRELREIIDQVKGPSPFNLSLAYGAASVPFVAAKYNLIITDVYKYFGKSSPQQASDQSMMQTCCKFWQRNIQPGLLWSFIRDVSGTGGGIVMGPIAAAKVASMASGNETPSRPEKLAGGFLAGCVCGISTQWLHNTALTAGRMTAESGGVVPGAFQCLRQTFKERGLPMCFLNFHFRVMIIGIQSAILTLTGPFDQ